MKGKNRCLVSPSCGEYVILVFLTFEVINWWSKGWHFSEVELCSGIYLNFKYLAYIKGGILHYQNEDMQGRKLHLME
jgi:hypothetical protein